MNATSSYGMFSEQFNYLCQSRNKLLKNSTDKVNLRHIKGQNHQNCVKCMAILNANNIKKQIGSMTPAFANVCIVINSYFAHVSFTKPTNPQSKYFQWIKC